MDHRVTNRLSPTNAENFMVDSKSVLLLSEGSGLLDPVYKISQGKGQG